MSFFILICLRYKKFRVMRLTAGFSFFKLKLILVFIFGFGYLVHCGLYIWKHTFEEDCPENRQLDIAFETSSVIYTFITLYYFALFYDSKPRYTAKEFTLLFFASVANVCIWVNAIVFESDFLYEKHEYFYNSSTIFNVTNSSNRAVEAIEKIDIFCSPAMVEFSLIAIEMLFKNHDNSIEALVNSDKKTMRERSSFKKKCHFGGTFCRYIFALFAVGFFVFVLTVVLITNSFDNFLDIPEFISIYFGFHLLIKIVMIVLISFCLYFEWNFFKFKESNIFSSIVLWTTCIFNFGYHLIYFFALCDDELNQSFSSAIVWIPNIISVILAPLQSLFIMGIDSQYYASSRHYNHCSQTNFVYNACFIMGVLNLGLWASDSIGEHRRSIFSILYYWTYGKISLSIIYTIVFPITVYFRFYTGLEFLNLFWKIKTEL